MIPRTKNGFDRMLLISAMQKHIRRGNERAAMGCAMEVSETDAAGLTMTCNRLEVISHEDIGDHGVIMLVATCMEQAKRLGKSDADGRARLIIGNAIRAMCRSTKSREGCHFALTCGLEQEHEGYQLEIPDWAMDMHTVKGRQMGRGLTHFLDEGAKLIPPPIVEDLWEQRAKELLHKYHKHRSIKPSEQPPVQQEIF